MTTTDARKRNSEQSPTPARAVYIAPLGVKSLLAEVARLEAEVVRLTDEREMAVRAAGQERNEARNLRETRDRERADRRAAVEEVNRTLKAAYARAEAAEERHAALRADVERERGNLARAGGAFAAVLRLDYVLDADEERGGR